MQAEMLPTATVSNAVICHLAGMGKRGDPLIGRRVREARDRLELSQEQLAELSGVSRSHIAGIESVQRTAGRQTLMNLARCFNVPVDYFTNRDELLATAMWVLGRLPPDELESWVKVMMARATSERLPPRD